MDRPPLPLITPMAPTLIAQPFHRDDWVYEEKYDGWRVIAYKTGRAVRLVSRAGRDLTARFPELAAAVGALPARTLILDGEVAVFDAALVSRFEWLRRASRHRSGLDRTDRAQGEPVPSARSQGAGARPA
jgi:bifunctional non-homologous end joining protein LigD